LKWLKACSEIRFLRSTDHWLATIEFKASVAFTSPIGRHLLGADV
jgi:hypothetical protein